MLVKASPGAGYTKKSKPLPPDFETFESAKLARNRLIGQLHKLDDPAATALVDVLGACRKASRCGSGACPVCNRAFRIHLAGEAHRVRPSAFDVLRISLIPASFRVESGGLADFDLRRWVSSRHRAIERALPPESLFAGGVDVSLNTLENTDPHWCFHIYGFVLLPLGWGVHNRSKVRRFRAELERRCPPVPKVDRVGAEKVLTVAAMDSDSFDDAVLYAHKGDFYRRSRYAYKFLNRASSPVACDAAGLSGHISTGRSHLHDPQPARRLPRDYGLLWQTLNAEEWVTSRVWRYLINIGKGAFVEKWFTRESSSPSTLLIAVIATSPAEETRGCVQAARSLAGVAPSHA